MDILNTIHSYSGVWCIQEWYTHIMFKIHKVYQIYHCLSGCMILNIHGRYVSSVCAECLAYTYSSMICRPLSCNPLYCSGIEQGSIVTGVSQMGLWYIKQPWRLTLSQLQILELVVSTGSALTYAKV